MPTFKLNGNTYSGSSNYAASVKYINNINNITTVQAELDRLNTLSDGNLLVNSDFAFVINQRNQLYYEDVESAHRQWTIDRWSLWYESSFMYYPRLEVNNSSITLTGTRTSNAEAIFPYAGMNQLVLITPTADNIYTFSVKIDGQIYQHTAQIDAEHAEVQVPLDADSSLYFVAQWYSNVYYNFSAIHTGIFVDLTKKSSIDIEWVKLEKGNIATPFVPTNIFDTWELCRLFAKMVPSFGHIARIDTDTITVRHMFSDWTYGMLQPPTLMSVESLNIFKNNEWQGGLDQWTVENVETYSDTFIITYRKPSHSLQATDIINVCASLVLDGEF